MQNSIGLKFGHAPANFAFRSGTNIKRRFACFL